MITCQFNGRLGNQMFQISAAYSLAVDNNDTATFPIQNSPHQHTIFKHLQVATAPHLTVYREPFFDYNPITYHNSLTIIGFFQSEKYFIHNKSRILELFYPSIFDIDLIRSKYRFELVNHTCSVHVRRGDYIALANNHPPCQMDYYQTAMKQFPSTTQFLIFSDDIPWCKTQFIGDQFCFIEGNTDYMDLYLMTQCNHHIIANSSFSWWGAWLNQNPNKIVIAPSKWFGPGLQHHKTQDITPDVWIKI